MTAWRCCACGTDPGVEPIPGTRCDCGNETFDRMFSTPAGLVERFAYVKYLRECAARWRSQGRGCEEQAVTVEAKADRIANGEDE